MGVKSRKLNVRHVNGYPLDCRRENRVVRMVQKRLRNKRKAKLIKGEPPTSQFKGVRWEWSTKMWCAQIAAAEAYDEAARR